MMLDAGSLEGFSVSRHLTAWSRWTAVCAEGDAWLAVAERNTREPVQAAVKALLWPWRPWSRFPCHHNSARALERLFLHYCTRLVMLFKLADSSFSSCYGENLDCHLAQPDCG